MLIEPCGVAPNWCIEEPLFCVMDCEVFPQTARVLPHVVNWPIEEDVVVRLAFLQDGLAAGDVRVEGRKIAPDRVLRIEFGGSVELPTWPGGVSRRVSRAVIYGVVHSREKLLVDYFL